MGKRLGQHFLRSPSVLENILFAAAVQPGDPVLEIGPGEGVLSERLLETGALLTVVELDPVLADGLERRWEGHPRFRLIRGDILKTDLSAEALFGGIPGEVAPGQKKAENPHLTYAVVANLPYYLSTPLLFRLTEMRHRFSRLVLMVQKEVARRMVSTPKDGKAYGSLSIAAAHAFTLDWVCSVPPSAFKPPPKVDSAVISLQPLPAELSPAAEKAFLYHIKMLFTRRRKQMLSGLSADMAASKAEGKAQISPRNWAEVEALVGKRRAESLNPAEHLKVFRLLYPGEVDS